MAHGSLSGGAVSRALSICVGLGLLVLASFGATAGRSGTPLHAECAACCETTCDIAAETAMPRAFCFDPNNMPSPEVMAWINSLHDTSGDFTLASSYWGSGSGTPVTLTWSLVPDGTSVPGLSGQANAPSILFSRMNQLFNNNQALWIGLIEQSFDRWSDLTGITFVRVTYQGNPWDDGAAFPNSGGSSARGHFRIGMRQFSSSGVLAFNYYPTVSDMVINSSVSWSSFSNNNYRYFRNTVMHEIGHGLGLAHCCPQVSSKLLEPALSTQFDGPQHDDIRGTHVRYGDFYEPNNSIGQARDVGSLEPGQSIVPSSPPAPNFNFSSRTSIDRQADQDWFRFNISGPLSLSVTVTPIGHTYASGPQLQSGQCSSGTAENSLAAAALAVQIYGPNTSTLLATADSNPAGQIESITSLPISQPGNYFVRVYSTSATGPQLYRLQISASPGGGTCPTFALHPDSIDVCEGDPIQLTVQATGNPAPTLQWRRNGVALGGATSNVFTLPSSTTFNGGTYDCVATNSCGIEISDPAIVTVNTAPLLLQHPENENVPVGAQATFTAMAIGTPAPNYRWFKDNEPYPGGIDGTLIIESVTLEDAGTYWAEAYNSCGSVPSQSATLTVEGGCYANCDQSTTPPILNVDDFTCFINAFAQAQQLPHEEQVTHYANCDGSTTAPVLNVDDFTCFINAFAQGCQ